MIGRFSLVVLGFFMFLFLISIASAAQIVTQDISGNSKTDFSPEEIVYIKGTEFSHNSVILVQVIRPDLVVDRALTISDNTGRFLYAYLLNGIKGNYYIYATDGVKSAQAIFTDAAIWTTDETCGDSSQDKNHYAIGDMIFINGDGFSSGNYSWTIEGKPGGASCDPNIVVASGIKNVNSSGAFCFDAYTVQNDDCGEYQVKFEQKGDNYRVEGGECTDAEDCGQTSSDLSCQDTKTVRNDTFIPGCVNNDCVLTNITSFTFCGNDSSSLICSGNNVFNKTVSPTCSDGACITLNQTNFVKSCGNSSSSLVCFGNNITNVTIRPGCSSGACFNITTNQTIQQCPVGNSTITYCEGNVSVTNTTTFLGCSSASCVNQTQSVRETCNFGCSDGICNQPVCGNGIKEGSEQCDDGNLVNGDGCNNQCINEICGDNVVQPTLGEQCELPNTNNNAFCSQSTLQCSGNKTGTRDSFGSCGSVCACNNDQFVFVCVPGSCGAQCGSNADCNDGNSNTLDICNLDSCGCSNIPQPFCGDGIVQQGEECDDGNTNDNDRCNNECQIINCYNNSQCGTDLSNQFCSANNTVHNSTQYICNNPGTTDSFCSVINNQTTTSCGNPNSSLICLNNDVYNKTTTPSCIVDGLCSNSTSNLFVKDCGEPSSSLICIGNNITNISTSRGCSSASCFNNTIQTTVKQCQVGNTTIKYCLGNASITNTTIFSGCSSASCINQTQQTELSCQFGCIAGECQNQTEFCGDGIVQSGIGEQCEPPNSESCDSQCQFTECPNIDSDNDGVLDCDDMCPDSKPNEPVDENGCDIFQFCSKSSCGWDCFEADFLDNEDVQYPKDCTIGVVEKEGKLQQPICIPTEFSSMCAN